MLTEALARSLGKANETLAQGGEGEFSYVVSELEISVNFAGIVLQDEGVLVELEVPAEQVRSEQFIRLKLLPVAAVAPEPAEPPPIQVPNVRRASIDASLVALAQAGVDMKQVQVVFDPNSRYRPGQVVRQSVHLSSVVGQSPAVELTVAGPPPS